MSRLPTRRVLAMLVCGLLAATSSLPQQQKQTAPQQTAHNDQQLQMAPRPNPKYAKKVADLGDKALSDGRADEALAYYEEAARFSPQDMNIVERFASLRSRLVRDHVDAAERDALAGHADVATEELAKA